MMTTRRRAVTRPYRLNCLLFVLSLWWQGRASRLRRKNGHWLATTRRGNTIHFRACDRGRVKGCLKLWFLGQPEVIRTRRKQ